MIGFTKAHACGNDFLIVEGICDPALAVRLCARNTGVGADGVEFFNWTGERSGQIRLVNADGSVAEISGNGTRCVAAWMAHQRKAQAGAVFEIETDAGVRICHLVDMAEHRFGFATGMGIPVVQTKTVTLGDGTAVDGIFVSMGNPHFVIFVEDDGFESHGRSWHEIGREICFHPDFPEQTNVEIRIFERGVGPTTSSGTGSSATAAATIALRGANTSLLVKAPGGEQRAEWPRQDAELILTGPAELIATGEAW
jgi:diaminopimelate epimerase